MSALKALDSIVALARVRYWTRALSFSKRQIFLAEVRPILGEGIRAAWPDCVMLINNADVRRALAATEKPRTPLAL